MTKFNPLLKKTITVDIKPGESLLVINKKKKLPLSSKITFEGKNIINIAIENTKRLNTDCMSLIKIYLTSLNPIRPVGKQCCEAISNYTELSLEQSELELKNILKKLLCPNVDAVLKNFPLKLEDYEKQRLMFALAFLIKPRLVILDDTVFKMEPQIKAYILKELVKLRKENNSSLIFISNKIDNVNEGVDIIAIMYKGTVVEFAKKDLILTDPIHPYTKHLLNHKNSLDFTEKQSEIINYVKNINNIPKNGCSFCLNCKEASYDCVYMAPKIKTVGKVRQVICNNASISI